MKTNEREGKAIQHSLSHFLSYRITPPTTTNVPWSELIFKRGLRTRLDLRFIKGWCCSLWWEEADSTKVR